jgi:hypothetical protein
MIIRFLPHAYPTFREGLIWIILFNNFLPWTKKILKTGDITDRVKSVFNIIHACVRHRRLRLGSGWQIEIPAVSIITHKLCHKKLAITLDAMHSTPQGYKQNIWWENCQSHLWKLLFKVILNYSKSATMSRVYSL